MTDREELLERLRLNDAPDNALDIAIDLALFKPDEQHKSVRANDAGTKLVYTRRTGGTDTFLARDHTLNSASRAIAASLLRSLPQDTK